MNISSRNAWKFLLTVTLLSTPLSGCGSSDPPKTAGSPSSETEKLYVTLPDQGVVQSIHIEGTAASKGGQKTLQDHPLTPTFAVNATINMKSNTVPGAKPGEIVFSEGFAYVRLTDSNFVQRFDLEGDGAGQNHPIELGVRPIHMFVDPDSKVWVGNDGPAPAPGQSCPGSDPACGPDTVSVINKGASVAHPPVTIGSGHHGFAFSRPSTLKPNLPKRAFIYNLHDDTISVIDNDPASPTYLQVISADPSLNGKASLKVGANPHGIAFSPASGKVYVPDADPNATEVMWIIDPETLGVQKMSKGSGPNQIPVVGGPVVRHIHDDPTDGQFIYLLGSLTDTNANTTTGYLTVIDTFSDPHPVTVTTFPGINPSRIVFTPDGKKAYIGTRSGAAPTPDLKNNLVVVLNTDPTSPQFNQKIGEITVGRAASSRPGLLVSGDGRFVFIANAVPASGGNPAETSLSVIDTTTDTVINTIPLDGMPSGLGIVQVGAHGH